jgi:hypothetical protein
MRSNIIIIEIYTSTGDSSTLEKWYQDSRFIARGHLVPGALCPIPP